jgi:hypothetical protein
MRNLINKKFLVAAVLGLFITAINVEATFYSSGLTSYNKNYTTTYSCNWGYNGGYSANYNWWNTGNNSFYNNYWKPTQGACTTQPPCTPPVSAPIDGGLISLIIGGGLTLFGIRKRKAKKN